MGDERFFRLCSAGGGAAALLPGVTSGDGFFVHPGEEVTFGFSCRTEHGVPQLCRSHILSQNPGQDCLISIGYSIKIIHDITPFECVALFFLVVLYPHSKKKARFAFVQKLAYIDILKSESMLIFISQSDDMALLTENRIILIFWKC